MSIIDVLYTILIMPLQLFFEVVYNFFNHYINNPGMSIIVLSLTMNFLVLPLYRRADAMQEEEKNIEQKLQNGIQHIKRTFKGDERMMILQTYYRQNHYRPTDVIKGSLSLFLEIPFFIAAYHFLSNLDILQGMSFGVIRDLGAPDALIPFMGQTINVLPILMTVINMISSFIFTKGYPIKTKMQLYVMALFFLVFLYNSPSGLVFYWTLNNTFSLVKTICYKFKSFRKMLTSLMSAVQRNKLVNHVKCVTPDRKNYLVSALLMTVLVGVLIPSALLKASPQEFVNIYNYQNPVWNVIYTFCLAIGYFIVWGSVFYWIANNVIKLVFEAGMWVCCAIAVTNYMFFGKKLGLLNNALQYENGLFYSINEQIINCVIILGMIGIVLLCFKKWKNSCRKLIMLCAIALLGMGLSNIVAIHKSVSQLKDTVSEADAKMPSITLSKSGQNVVVLMLDRSIGAMIPYLFNEKPELYDIYEGFTYYENVISFGGFTNFGTPPIFGGYEYTPYEMNCRKGKSLIAKHNEALKVMPVLFSQNGFHVTVCDPTYAGYRWVPDLSIYDEYPEIEKYISNGKFYHGKNTVENRKMMRKRFWCYSILKVAPVCAQHIVYDNGQYNLTVQNEENNPYTQIIEGTGKASGLSDGFMNSYTVLQNMSNMTTIDDGETNHFLLMTNDTTHDVALLSEPDYEPDENIDNVKYDEQNVERFIVDGRKMNMETSDQYAHYQSNMAALLQVGNWLEYLKENDVYDNTRIIIVSDHGRALGQFEEMILDDGSEMLYDTEFYYPTLLVKDFNSKEFTVSDEFMTNGDVPTLAFKDIIEHPINPFTDNEINSDEKYEHYQFVLASYDFDIGDNRGRTFLPGKWFAVHDDRNVKENWIEVDMGEFTLH